MDGETAWRLFNEGNPLSLMVRGRPEDGALITGLHMPDDTMDLLLRTPIGKPERRVRVRMDEVELLPS
jgi:hypothetical protein